MEYKKYENYTIVEGRGQSLQVREFLDNHYAYLEKQCTDAENIVKGLLDKISKARADLGKIIKENNKKLKELARSGEKKGGNDVLVNGGLSDSGIAEPTFSDSFYKFLQGLIQEFKEKSKNIKEPKKDFANAKNDKNIKYLCISPK